MSAKSKRIERSQRFKRAFRGENRRRAVSPVVATLILILIAVAAAAALYLWLVVWQGNITGGIGNQHAEPTLTVGGSTSVYPFSSLAATWFEQNNSDVVISDNQGGTGAGMIALCTGNIEIGASSTPQTVASLESGYGCSSTYASTITITTIAYDAVDVIVQSSNPHGLLSISADTLNDIYEAGSSSEGKLIGSIDGVAIGTTGTDIRVQGTGAITANTPLDWYDIPAAVFGATVGTATEAVDTGGYSTANVATQLGTLTGFPNLIYDASGAAGTPCGFNICAGGASAAAAAAAIVPISRSDASGTTQTFEAKLLGYGSGASSSSSSWVGDSGAASAGAQDDVASFANLGYAGCGSNNLLTDCGWTFTAAEQGNGETGVLSLVASNPNAIGYSSDGLARTTPGVGPTGIIPFLGLGQGIETNGGSPTVGFNGLFSTSSSTYAYGGVIPTTGTSGTIAGGLTSSASVNNYVGGRPFQLISLEPLTGIGQEWVTFITDPAVNAALASATDEVGLYQVV